MLGWCFFSDKAGAFLDPFSKVTIQPEVWAPSLSSTVPPQPSVPNIDIIVSLVLLVVIGVVVTGELDYKES